MSGLADNISAPFTYDRQRDRPFNKTSSSSSLSAARDQSPRDGSSLESFYSPGGAHIRKDDSVHDDGHDMNYLLDNAIAPAAVSPYDGERSVATSFSTTGVAVQRPEAAVTLAEFHLRILLDSVVIGVIIGRQGANIKAIRDVSGARINISKKTDDSERVMTISGAIDIVAKATALASRKMTEGALQNAATPDTIENTVVTVRVLVPHHQMGNVIGKGGASIRKIQEESNARLSASEETLPGSTDRIVNIIGVPDAVHIASFHLCDLLAKHESELASNPNRRHIHHTPYVPGPQNQIRDPPTGGYRTGHGPMDLNRGNYGMYGNYNNGGNNGGANVGIAMLPGGGAFLSPSLLGDSQFGAAVSRQLYVPERLIGNMIGKGGTRINHIRQSTGCKISIDDVPATVNGERPITVTGPPASNDLAFRMLNERLNMELSRVVDNGEGNTGSNSGSHSHDTRMPY